MSFVNVMLYQQSFTFKHLIWILTAGQGSYYYLMLIFMCLYTRAYVFYISGSLVATCCLFLY